MRRFAQLHFFGGGMYIDPALLGPVSALMGALIGGSTSLVAAVYTQRYQDRLQRVASEVATVSVSARNRPVDRDPAVVLLSQLKEIYIDAKLQLIETAQWYPRIMRKDYTIGLSISENSV